MKLERYRVKELGAFSADRMTGRQRILTPVNTITAENVTDVLEAALGVHAANAAEITYLWNYYRGRQDVRNKQKITRQNINNKITVNRANEIVTFKTAYLLNEPVQFISNGGDDKVSEDVNRLNDYMRAEDKESKDKELVDWLHICGIAERFTVNDEMSGENDGAPFDTFVIDPRFAFVIYSAKISRKPMAGVIIQTDTDGTTYADVYTETECFTVKGDTVTATPHILGGIPLVEYENNMARMGAFECVISILNGINQLESNAVDSVEDFVNGFDVFQNCEISDGDYAQLSLGGKAIAIKTVTQGMEAKVYRIASELNQTGVQTRIDNMTEEYLTICGMPNRNGGSSTSDTGTATIFRDGWAEAESRAKDSEKLFIRSEKQFLRLVLNICNSQPETALRLGIKDIRTEFLRKSLSNLQSKTQVLCELLGNEYVHPKMAYETAALFKDNEQAYRLGMEWHDTQEAIEAERLKKEIANERLRFGGQNDTGAQTESGTEA